MSRPLPEPHNEASRAHDSFEGDPSTASQTRGTTDLSMFALFALTMTDLHFMSGVCYWPHMAYQCLAVVKPRPGLTTTVSISLLAGVAKQQRPYLW